MSYCAAMTMRVEVVSDPHRLSALEPAWSELADVVGARPFARPSWCRPWWDVMGRGRLSVITVRDASELVALAPFHVRRLPLLPAVRFLGHGLGAVSAPLVAPGHQDAAARLWETALVGRQVVELVECDERAPALEALSDGYCVQKEYRDACPVVRFGNGFDEFMSGRNRDLHRILRRARAKLDARGLAQSTDVATDSDGVSRLLPAVMKVTDAAEKAKPRQHLLAGRLGEFTRALLAHTARAGDLSLFVSHIGDEPVAYAVTLRDGNGIAMWLNRHDPSFGEFAPGHMLLQEMSRFACRNGLGHLDLLIGDVRYKRLWADERYRTLDVTVATSKAKLLVAQRQAMAIAGVRRAWAARG